MELSRSTAKMKWCLMLVLVICALVRANKKNNDVQDPFKCPELKEQAGIDLDKIMDKWYVVQIIENKIDAMRPPTTGHIVVDSCPVVTLRPYEYSSLKILWSEAAGELEYTFHIPDTVRRPGYWISQGFQNGSLAQKQYRQFSGEVYVMKAVATDMELTFCAPDPNSQLYTLVLAREHSMTEEYKESVKRLLLNRGLSYVVRRDTCLNGSGTARVDTLKLHGWTSLLCILTSRFLVRSWQ